MRRPDLLTDLLICAVRSCQGLRADEVVDEWSVCARVPMLISVRGPGLATGVGDMMVMGFSLGGGCGAAARSLEAVHADVAAAGCGELAAVHRLTWGVARMRKLMRARAPGRRVL